MSWLKNLSIRLKLLSLVGIFMLGMAFITFEGFQGAERVKADTTKLFVRDLVGLKHVEEAAVHTLKMTRAVRNYALANSLGDSATARRALEERDASEKELRANVDAAKDLFVTEEGRALMAQLPAAVETVSALQKRVVGMFQAGDPAALATLMRECHVASSALEKLLSDLAASKYRTANATMDAAVQSANSEEFMLVGTFAVVAALGLAYTIFITGTVVKPVQEIASLVERVAAGDLTPQITADTSDELGRLKTSLASMVGELNKTLAATKEAADHLAATSAQITQGNIELSQRTEEQASALEETAASMEELGSTARLNSDNIREANGLASDASGSAKSGRSVMDQVVHNMRDIEDSSNKISEIISTIDGIAFQTNILALNAAVEAARAGEQGRGFAVVAGEVRTLAQRSAEAAKEIKGLITNSVARVGEGTALVADAGAAMDEIVKAIDRVTAVMAEVNSAIAEQSASVSQVSDAVSQMDQATQQNASLVEESVAAAESVKSLAGELAAMAGRFKLMADASQRKAMAASASTASKVSKPATSPKASPVAKVGASAPTSAAAANSPSRPAAKPAAAESSSPASNTMVAKASAKASSDEDEWVTF